MTTTPRLPTGLETTGARRITVGTCCSVSALGMAEGNGNVRDTRPCTPPALVRGTSWHGTEGRGGGMPRFDRLGLEVGLFHPNSSISESCLGKISKEGQSSEDAPCLCVCVEIRLIGTLFPSTNGAGTYRWDCLQNPRAVNHMQGPASTGTLPWERGTLS